MGKIKYDCKYPGCTNVYYAAKGHPNKVFHKFPTVPHLISQWKQACQFDSSVDTKRFKICCDHFERNDYKDSSSLEHLKITAVPHAVKNKLTSTSRKNDILMDVINGMAVDQDRVNLSYLHDHCYIEFNNEGSTISIKSSNLIPTSASSSNEHSYAVPERTSETINVYGSSDDEKDSTLDTNQKIINKTSMLKACLTVEKDNTYIKQKNKVFRIPKLNNLSKNKNIKNIIYINQPKHIERDDNANSKLHRVKKLIRNPFVNTTSFVFNKRKSRLQKCSIPTTIGNLPSTTYDSPITKTMLDYLKTHMHNLNDIDRNCALMFDEIPYHTVCFKNENGQEDSDVLKPGEDNSTIAFMITIISNGHTILLAKFFNKSPIDPASLQAIILKIIKVLRTVRVNIVATVCKQNPTNKQALSLILNDHSQNKSNHNFMVDGQRIAIIFSVARLLKDTRDTLLAYNIEFEKDKIAKFMYIEVAYTVDKASRKYRCLPKLTEEHFNFKNNWSKMKEQYSIQQLSHSVAAAMETFHHMKILPDDALHTAEFVSLMDSLFDTFNSSSVDPSDGKNYRCAISDNSPHVDFWLEMLRKLSNWKIVDTQSGQVQVETDLVEGWERTIKGTMSLWSILKRRGFSSVPLRNLNMEALENSFGQKI